MENNFLNLKLDNYKPLREVVFESIRAAIISGDLKPGERLMEVQLAEKLGVSRTPVREAIRKLELEGLVVMVVRKGVYVAGLSIKDITDVFELRGALEGLAAGLAAERITEEELVELQTIAIDFDKALLSDNMEQMVIKDAEFHDKIFNATRNERLIQLTNNLREQVQRFREMHIYNYNKSKELSVEHYEISDAISKRDVDQAEKMARKHIENTENYVMKMVEKGIAK